jgi:hypothetical protein
MNSGVAESNLLVQTQWAADTELTRSATAKEMHCLKMH